MIKKIYLNIAKDLSSFKEILKLRNVANYGSTNNVKRVGKLMEELAKNEDILPKDRIQYFTEQILDGLESDYGRDIANVKCKQFVFETGLSILTDLRSCVNKFNVQYSIAFNKKKEINVLLETITSQLEEVNKTKGVYEANMDNKVKLLECNRQQLSQMNNGEFFLNNSVSTLLKTLGRTAEFFFQETDLEIGSNTLHNFGINHTCQRLKYYTDKSEIDKFNNEEPIMVYNVDEVKKSLESLKHHTDGSVESIKDYIKKANVSDLNAQPDEPVTNATVWSDCTNKVVATLDRCHKNSNVVISRIKDLSEVNLKPIEDMINNLESIYKDIQDPNNENEENNKLIEDYLQLISIGVVSYNFFLEFNAYDVQTYLIDLNYLAFYSNILYELVTHYNKEMNNIYLDKIYKMKEEKQRLEEQMRQQKAQEEELQQQAQAQQANVNVPVDNNNVPAQAPVDNTSTVNANAADGTQVNVPANQPIGQ